MRSITLGKTIKDILKASILLMLLLSFGISQAQINEGFEGVFPPTSWTNNSCIQSGNNPRTGTKDLGFNAQSDSITTTSIANPGTLSFWYKRSSNTTAWSLVVRVIDASTGSILANLTSITSSTTTYQEYTANLSAYTNIKIRLVDARSTGTHERYVDDFSVSLSAGVGNCVLSNNGSQITAANVNQGTLNHVLSSFKLTQTVAASVLDSVWLITSGNYVSSDIVASGLKLWYNLTNDFSTATELKSSSSASAGSGEIIEFNTLAKNLIVGVHYFWVTASFDANATAGHTISVDAISNADLYFAPTITKSGSASAGGTQTILGSQIIQLSSNSLTGFTTTAGIASSTQTLTVSGDNLTANVVVNAPVNFEISTDNLNFLASTTLTQSSGNIIGEPLTLYVRIASSAALGAISGDITFSSTGATSKLCAVSGFVLKAEPANHPSLVTCGTAQATQLSINWTDASLGVLPDGYLIKWSSVSYAAIGSPVDGSVEPDGIGVYNSAQGVQTATLTSLVNSTTYYIKIWSYTNSGASINYKTDGSIEQLSCSTINGPCLFESFGSGAMPLGFVSTNVNYTVNAGTASLNANSGELTTSALSNPREVRFDLIRTTSATLKSLEVQISTSSQSSGFTTIKTYDHSNTIPTDTNVCIIDLSAYSLNPLVYIRFNKPSSTTAAWKIDNINVFCNAASSPSTLALSDNGTQVSATMVGVGTNNHVLASFKLEISNASTFVDTIIASTIGNYTSSDISASGLKLYYTTNNTFSTTELLKSISSSAAGVGESLRFEGVSKSLLIGTHYFWLTASISASAVNGNTISVNSLSANDLKVFGSISKSGNASASGTQTFYHTPLIQLSTSSLSGFTSFQGSPSSAQTFTVSADYLTNDVVLNAPSNFEISSDNSTFTSSITLTRSGQNLLAEPVTIYVRILANPALGSISGSISLTSVGALTQLCALSGTVLKYEPTNNPSLISCGTSAPTACTINWTDAVGSVLPDGYLIKWSSVSYAAITDPVDGTAVADGSNSKNIAQGIQTAVLAGLAQGTTYYFKIWAYSNSGVTIDYKTNGTLLQLSCSSITGPCLTENFTSGIVPVSWLDNNVLFSSGVASFEAFTGELTTYAVSNPTELRFDLSQASTATKSMIVEVCTSSQTGVFTPVTTFSQASMPVGTTTKIVDLSAYQAFTTVYIRFRKSSSTTAYWRIDNVQTSCGFSLTAPVTQTSSIVFSAVVSNAMTVSWTNGSGARRVVLMNTANSFVNPINGADPTANSVYSGSGQQVVYNGIGNSVNISGLTAGTTYWFRSYEYDNTGVNTLFNTSTATLNPTYQYTSPNNVSNFVVNCISNTTATLKWTPPVGVYQGVIIAIRQSTNAVHSINGRGDTLVANSAFGGGSFFGSTAPESYVVYNGIGNTVSITGLTPGQSYTFKAYTYNGTLWSSGSSKAAVQAIIPEVSTLQHYAPNQSIVLSWTNPIFACADEVMVVVRAINPITSIPSGNGLAYLANASFGVGTDLGFNEYVVYKGNSNHVTITGLTNGTLYHISVFVRDGSDWSTGVSTSDSPSDITVLLPGDLAVVALNTAYGGSSPDQISIVCFDTIKTGTSIDFTDNGWERSNATKWGNSEGTVRFTRTGPPIMPGQVFTFTGSGHVASGFTASGLVDNSWTMSSLNNNFDFNLNQTDQLWVMQFGVWDPATPSGQNSTYSGNVLYGWTATGWAGDPGHGAITTTSYSKLYPNATCFNTNVVGTSSNDKVKYTGDTTAATQREWIRRINTSANWTGYSSNINFDAGGYPYSDSITFRILSNVNSNGTWLGSKDTNWFDCNNWSDLAVPNEYTDVSIDASATNDAVIDVSLNYSNDFNDTARCANLDITSRNLVLRNTNDYLKVSGNILINGGKIGMTNGNLTLKGNWINQQASGFLCGYGKIVFDGFNQQTIENFTTSEQFHHITINNTNGIKLKSSVQIDSLNFLLGNVEIDTASIEIKNTIIGADESKYIVTKDDKLSAGYLIMKAETTSTLFPIGNSTLYAPCYLSNVASPAYFKARTFSGLYENGTSGNALLGDMVNRSWLIQPINSAGINASLILQWNLPEELGSFSVNRNNAYPIRNSGIGTGTGFSDWLTVPNYTIPQGINPFTIEASTINTFGVFGISSGCSKPLTSLIHHY